MTHPSLFIAPEICKRLREYTAEAERERDLRPQQLEIIYQQQWFKVLVPPAFGGAALPLPELVRLEEGISWADGSVGWVMTLCSGAGWFAGFFAPDTSLSGLFSDNRLCLAGSGAASGQAHRQADGSYHISGRWAYASGALHATAFTANCTIIDQGQPVMDKKGQLLIRAFVLMPEEVTLHKDWDTIGLIATGSHAFEAKDVIVPEDRAFDISVDAAADRSPLYRYPFLPLAEATLAANISGMTAHFLDSMKALLGRRRLSAVAQREAEEAWEIADQELHQVRTEFYLTLDQSWLSPDEANLKAVSFKSRELTIVAREIVHQLYRYGGLAAAKPDSEINRVWRDFHTATQHNLLAFDGQ